MVKTKKGSALLAIAALGVVFGDIGTSPLYAMQAVFGPTGQRLQATADNVYGIISTIIWAITLVVSIKFIGFIMRADNQGEGGVTALIALVKTSKLQKHYKWLIILLGLAGMSLFYGDSVITPAISVLSAVEGLNVITPHLNSIIVPTTIVILVALFWIQKYGTAAIGRLFGPTMLIWFTVLGLGGLWQVWQHPSALYALSPITSINFFVSQPLVAFLAMATVMLAITGVEALYADLGHFGRPPITKAWFFVVFPALALCYMGEGALIVNDPSISGSVLVQMFPVDVRVPIVLLATVATLIASQAVISGTFSLTRQAIQLGFLPQMRVRHTSTHETGQIYMPFINFLLFATVILLVLTFGSSAKLANAYGIAVSGTLAISTVLYLVVLRSLWQKSKSIVALSTAVFLPIDLLLLTSSMQKLLHGGLLPVAIGVIVFLIIDTWVKGKKIVDEERKAIEGPLQSFIDTIHSSDPPIRRIPGAAVYISHHPGYTPLALRATVDDLHELPEKVVIVSVQTTPAAHVPVEQRAALDTLGYDDNICHLSLTYGFHDTVNIPKILKALRHTSPELDFDSDKASYFVSSSKVVPTRRRNMSGWRKTLFSLMSRGALSSSDYYKLPIKQTEEMQTLIQL